MRMLFSFENTIIGEWICLRREGMFAYVCIVKVCVCVCVCKKALAIVSIEDPLLIQREIHFETRLSFHIGYSYVWLQDNTQPGTCTGDSNMFLFTVGKGSEKQTNRQHRI